MPMTRRGSPAEVFIAFLRLGCTSFGGPLAHLGYFRRELVERRGWCSAPEFAQVVALSQALPGPASSQTGFALGVLRAGWSGGLAAWLRFTLPSFLLMLAFALAGQAMPAPALQLLSHAFALVALAVVADAVLRMVRAQAAGGWRLLLACAVTVLLLWQRAEATVLLAMAAGVGAGLLLGRAEPPPEGSRPDAPIEQSPVSRVSAALLVLFAVGLAAALLAQRSAVPLPWREAATFYRTGALVFGGGHVVLPLLEAEVVRSGMLSQGSFLAGYGAAQALPGPLFTVAAYLGASLCGASASGAAGPVGAAGAVGTAVACAAVCTVAIFLPGLLLMAAALPWWPALRSSTAATKALAGVNAAVTGVLAAVLLRTVLPAAIGSLGTRSGLLSLLLSVAGFAVLQLRRVPVLAVVVAVTAASVALSLR